MKLDYNKLSELLNIFGLSLKIENGSVIFVDVETNSPMKSYVLSQEGSIDRWKKYIADENILLSGWPFYLEAENKYFELNIFVKDENIKVYEINKTERKEPHLYERSELRANRRNYILEETTYRNHTREDGTECLFSRDFISNVKFITWEITDAYGGEILIETDNKSAVIGFEKNATTGEITHNIEDEDFVEISQQEATELIEQSRIFKDTMKTLCPTIAESYSNAKTSSVKPIR